jgi:hypothetical protein
MYKQYILCRGSQPSINFSDNIVKITHVNNIETIYINTGPLPTTISMSIDSLIIYQNSVISSNELLTGGTNINLSGIYDAGIPQSGVLDDGNVPIPMGGMVFNFFGVNYSSNMFWNSNNAITFGAMNPFLVSISHNTIPAILLGNYDRLLKKLSYKNSIGTNYSITTLYPQFFNYFTDNIATAALYTWRIRIIKQNSGLKNQYIEVCAGGQSTVPTTGYSSSLHVYPSGINIDSNGLTIDQTKTSPFNITDGNAFINLCGTIFGITSPLANTSFVFASDSTGSKWKFYNNSYVNV